MRRVIATGLQIASTLLLCALCFANSSSEGRAIESKAGQDASAYRLTAQIPDRIQKGEITSITLHVQKNGRPVDDIIACLKPAPLFVSEEDVTDTTAALGSDLGANEEPATQLACVTSIAAVRTAPGVYQFTWEPDTAGRINLQFTAGESRLEVPVNVRSAPPNPALLIAFVLFVGVILSTAAWMRRMRHRQGGST